MPLWTLPLLIVQTCLLLFAGYLTFLTLAALLHRAPRAQWAHPPRLRLAVLVPAHDEETLLPRLLESLAAGTYPRDLYDVLVVADNCTDLTAEVAHEAGAKVYAREDRAHTGKGYALQWLLEQIDPGHAAYDGYVFLDADCQVSLTFLDLMARRLDTGCHAVQAYYTAAEPFHTRVSALRFAALVLKHYVRPRGRAAIGLPCGLFGTGMAFSRAVMAAHGWSAFTLAEDVEYQLRLAKAGIYVTFEPRATVVSAMPTSLRQAKSQNLRWERGRLRLALSWGPELLAAAVRHRSWKKVDIFLEQAMPPLSILGALSFAMLPVSFIVGYAPMQMLALATLAGFGTHVLGGLLIARVPARTYSAFLFAPLFVAWKIAVYVRALLPGAAGWVRTQRS